MKNWLQNHKAAIKHIKTIGGLCITSTVNSSC